MKPALVFFAAVLAFWFWQQDHRANVMDECRQDGRTQSDCDEQDFWMFDADDGRSDTYR
jgi:hypothetical protein